MPVSRRAPAQLPAQVVIIVPAFRAEGSIAQTLDSIQSQGKALSAVESVILAEDHGADRTVEVARKHWEQKNTTLRITEASANRGEYRNLNETILQLAPEIEWVIILHDDNLAKANWLSTLLNRIENAEDRVASICTSWDLIQADGLVVTGDSRTVAEAQVYAGNRRTVRDTLFIGCWWHLSSCAIRVSAFKDAGMLPTDMTYKGDWDFLLRMYEHGWKIEYLPVALTQHRSNAESVRGKYYANFTDIRETLNVLRWHAWSLTHVELFRLHFQYFLTAAKRTLKALLWFEVAASKSGLIATGHVVLNYLVCARAFIAGTREELRHRDNKLPH